MSSERWLLPEGVEEVLAPASWRLEALRGRLLALFQSWGYELVLPPLIEYLGSLLTGAGRDLDLQTFKLTDQLNGRLMGVRADITPQVARIDASRMPETAPARLCYIGQVLRTRPEGPGGSRSPLQLGAELFGHRGPESDIEMLSLMLACLNQTGVARAHLDLGHVGVYRSLVESIGLDGNDERRLFDILQRKAAADLEEFIQEARPATAAAAKLRALIDLNGDAQIIGQARRALADAGGGVTRALEELGRAVDWLQAYHPGLPLHVDLAELRGYSYHTGLVYAAFVPGRGRELARGGRYDNAGAAFGRARPGIGFTADLAQLADLCGGANGASDEGGIYAPVDPDAALVQRVDELRASGRRVVKALPGLDPGPAALGCTHELVHGESGWEVRLLDA
jgi:ATP phosphoribosyltransferase regulatory subunit